MFDNLTRKVGAALGQLSGKRTLTEDNIAETLRTVRLALLEADVALDVVQNFLGKVRLRGVGSEVSASLSPGEAFLKIVNEELIEVLGGASEGLNLSTQPPAVILLAGLQGAGKTTTAAKLGVFVKERLGKQVMLVSADVYRPAAIEQLKTLASGAGLGFCESSIEETPLAIATRALQAAKTQFADVLIVDTAGRLAIDDELMLEISELHRALNPVETLFVVDAMTGQDAANTARQFGEVLPLTGVVVTKADGDARGGAALSVRQITGRPIKFIGQGEGVEALELFHPDRIASRILGMGDVMSLIEEAEQKIDKAKATKLAKKIQKGRGFDLSDFRDQIQQMNNMGGLTGMLDKLPGMANMADAAKARVDQQNFGQLEAIINSMTPKERSYPDVISGSRKRRIAMGSGTQIQDVNRLLKQHKQMQKMMKKMGRKGGMANMMRGMGGMLNQGKRPF
ncbi:MAG: signal recognition particle protein [Proteobacteria bacterium]|nr:signal recognition particle protein [Pseudomonadota bacterium]MDA1207575.1 signal recognition particle protein [Pseudomonadota bacterium]